jgi:hypothetical protein
LISHEGNNDTDGVDVHFADINELKEYPAELSKGIDYIFLCRSANRTPPHLDNDFEKAAKRLAEVLGQDEPRGLSDVISRWTEVEQTYVKKRVALSIIMHESIMEGRNHASDKETMERCIKMYQDAFGEPFNFQG